MKNEWTYRFVAVATIALLGLAPAAVAEHHEQAEETAEAMAESMQGEMAEGMDEMAEGAEEMAEGMKEMAEAKEEMAEGMKEMAEAKEEMATAAPAISGMMSDVLKNLEFTAGRMAQLAEATPADKFSWAPNDEVRTVSEVYIHVVAANMMLPAALGATPPEGLPAGDDPFAVMAEMERTITDKADVVAKLNESFAYLARALPTITDLDTEVTLFGPPASKRSYVFILLGHAHEHLGQSIAYARSVGVVPPWSQPPPAAEGGEAETEG